MGAASDVYPSAAFRWMKWRQELKIKAFSPNKFTTPGHHLFYTVCSLRALPLGIQSPGWEFNVEKIPITWGYLSRKLKHELLNLNNIKSKLLIYQWNQKNKPWMARSLL